MKVSFHQIIRAEYILVSLSVLGILLKVFVPFPGLNLLLTMCLTTQSMFYGLAAFGRFAYGRGEIELKDILRSKTAKFEAVPTVFMMSGLSIAVGIIGVWQFLLLIPGALIALCVAALAGTWALILTLFFQYRKKDDYLYRNIIRLLTALLVFAAFIFLPRHIWLQKEFADYPEMIEAIKATDANPGDTVLVRKERELLRQIRDEEHGEKNRSD